MSENSDTKSLSAKLYFMLTLFNGALANSTLRNFFQNQKHYNLTYFSHILIFRKFSKSTFLGIPLTASLKNDMFHYPFKYKEHKESCASLSQIKLFDTKRINQKDGKMSVEDFNGLKVKLKELMDL